MHGFQEQTDTDEFAGALKLWVVQLHEDSSQILERLFSSLQSPEEVCPIVPFPSRDPRRGDRLLMETRSLWQGDWGETPLSLIYADDKDPTDVFRTITELHEARVAALEPVQGHHSFSFKCPRCGLSRRYSPASLHGLVTPNEVTLRRGDVFFYDRVTPDVVLLAERARLNGAITVFEPSSLESDAGLLGRALRSARVVKYSSDRLGPAALEALDAGFVEIQTLGARGLRFRMRSLDPSWVELPALLGVSVVDAAGAGDWCTAGFLYMLGSLAEQAAPSELGYNRVHGALKAGQFLAALNCATVGARGLMRAVDASRLRTRLEAFVGLDDELQAVGDSLGCSAPDLLACFSDHAWGGRSGHRHAPALCDCAVGCRGGSAWPRRSGTAGGSIH